MAIQDKLKWWQEAVIYEIYPRSFMDSNNDGIGDLKGIISKLDYIKSLGIDAIWLCPVYSTPNMDGGYDVANYYDICSDLGTLRDMKKLIEQAHKRHIKIIMELVANHTSDQHKWFKNAKLSKENNYRDYYIWKRPKKDGSYPNNWISSKTNVTVWSKTEETDEYYLHLYTKNQPDLNWTNEAVRKEIYHIIEFWFLQGIDGFRMDVINKIAKEPDLPDVSDQQPYFHAEKYFENHPHIHYYLKEMYQEVLMRYPNNVSIGQTSGVSPEQALLYTEHNRKELDLFLQFEHVDLDRGPEGKKLVFDIYAFKNIIFKWQSALEGRLWNTVFFGSHDLPRMVSHFGDDGKYHEKSAKMLATIQLFLRGTQIIYMGDEIGMTNINYNNIEDYVDNRSVSIYDKRVNEKMEDKKTVLSDIRALARDNARYPMQWDNSFNGGFSKVRPWMKVNKNYKQINVKNQENDEKSILSYYKKLIQIRKNEKFVHLGTFEPIFRQDKDLFAYKRVYNKITMIVIANMSMNNRAIELKNLGKCILHNYDNIQNVLRPYEVIVYKSNNG